MAKLTLQKNMLGFEIHQDDRPLTLYRATEELPRTDSPKPCFAPIYTPSGTLVTEYRPADHTWHTGLYFGWVHANEANLWGGPWYLPETKKYEYVEHSHGVQRHDEFARLEENGTIEAEEKLTWLDADDGEMAREVRSYTIASIKGGTSWQVATTITPTVDKLVLGASIMSHYSGFELRMGPPFADAFHYDSEGRETHESIMGQRARWVAARGATGGCVAMMDHPSNPRHPVTWFARKNLLGAGLLMEEDLTLHQGENLDLHYAFFVFDDDPGRARWEELYGQFTA
jgi:hypothetical protein